MIALGYVGELPRSVLDPPIGRSTLLGYGGFSIPYCCVICARVLVHVCVCVCVLVHVCVNVYLCMCVHVCVCVCVRVCVCVWSQLEWYLPRVSVCSKHLCWLLQSVYTALAHNAHVSSPPALPLSHTHTLRTLRFVVLAVCWKSFPTASPKTLSLAMLLSSMPVVVPVGTALLKHSSVSSPNSSAR